MRVTETGCAEDFPTLQTLCEIFMLVKITRRNSLYTMCTYKRFLSSVNVFTLEPSESSKDFLTMVTHIRLLTSVKSFRSVMITRAAEGYSTILMCINELSSELFYAC